MEDHLKQRVLLLKGWKGRMVGQAESDGIETKSKLSEARKGVSLIVIWCDSATLFFYTSCGFFTREGEGEGIWGNN